MSEQMLIFGYLVCVLAGLALVAIFYEQRRKRFEPERTEDHIFRCQNCAFVYTDDPDVERSRCPQCGKLNEQYQF